MLGTRTLICNTFSFPQTCSFYLLPQSQSATRGHCCSDLGDLFFAPLLLKWVLLLQVCWFYRLMIWVTRSFLPKKEKKTRGPVLSYLTIRWLYCLEWKSYQCILAVCRVSPVKDGLGQAAIGLRSMFTSHLSYRAGSLPSAWTESPWPLPSPLLRRSAWQMEGLNRREKRTKGLPPWYSALCCWPLTFLHIIPNVTNMFLIAPPSFVAFSLSFRAGAVIQREKHTFTHSQHTVRLFHLSFSSPITLFTGWWSCEKGPQSLGSFQERFVSLLPVKWSPNGL